MLDFNETIKYPEEMTREGFTFAGWSPKPERMPAENITIKANWTITSPTEYVEIVFSQKDLSEEDIRNIIKEFVSGETDFEVEQFENDSGETTVIVKFSDKETAEKFVENVSTYDREGDGTIKRVGFTSDYYPGFSPALCHPLTLLSLVFVL